MDNQNSNITETDDLMNALYKEITESDNQASIDEYKKHIEEVQHQFLEKTRIQKADISFLFIGVMLQCLRIYLINKLTAIEEANVEGGREDRLHEAQEKILGKFSKNEQIKTGNYYSSLDAIITLRGVPYDATKQIDEIKLLKLFKGANHRFSTLGHDPALGLIFGTSNILTNTITMIEPGKVINPIPTYHVIYDPFLKNPIISSEAGTMRMLQAVEERCKTDRISVVAALIKQLIHIATDIYTPKGIPLPGIGMVLNKSTVDRLTDYVSTGDILKIGASAGASILINTLIAAIHGSGLIFKDSGEAYNKELYQARTRKVLLYSNIIASSSNLISTAVTADVKNLDIGGLMVTIYRVFSDTKFICKLEEEFINSEVSKIYIEKETLLMEKN